MGNDKQLQHIQCLKIKKSNNMPEFVLKVTWTDGSTNEVTRSHSAFSEFITKLGYCFRDRKDQLPELKSCDWFNKSVLIKKNEKKEVDLVCQKLVELPTFVTHDELMTSFFSNESLNAFHVAYSKKSHQLSCDNQDAFYDSLAFSPITHDANNCTSVTGNIYGELLQDPDEKANSSTANNNTDGEFPLYNEIGTDKIRSNSSEKLLYCDINPRKEDNQHESYDHLFCKVKKPYSGQNRDNISIDVGQVVQIVDSSMVGWFRIRTGDNEGMVPDDCLDTTNCKSNSNDFADNVNENDKQIIHNSDINTLSNGINLNENVAISHKNKNTENKDIDEEEETAYYNSNVRETPPQLFKVVGDFGNHLKNGTTVQSSMIDSFKNLLLCKVVCNDDKKNGPNNSTQPTFHPIAPVWVPMKFLKPLDQKGQSVQPRQIPEKSPKKTELSATSSSSPKPASRSIASSTSPLLSSSPKRLNTNIYCDIDDPKNQVDNERKGNSASNENLGKLPIYTPVVKKNSPPSQKSANNNNASENTIAISTASATTTNTNSNVIEINVDNNTEVKITIKTEPPIAKKPLITEKPNLKPYPNVSSQDKPMPVQKPLVNKHSNTSTKSQIYSEDLNNLSANGSSAGNAITETDYAVNGIKYTLVTSGADASGCIVYHIDRQATNELLSNCKPGCFLFRKSLKQPKGITLSVVSSLPFQIHHFIVGINNGKYNIGNFDFESLDQIVHYYRNESITEPSSGRSVKLTTQFLIDGNYHLYV